MMAARNKGKPRNTVVSMFPEPDAAAAVVVEGGGSDVAVEVAVEVAPKKTRKPRIVRPVGDRLSELKAKYEAFKSASEKKIKAFEHKIAFLGARAAKVATDDEVLAQVEGKSADDIERELLEAARKLAVLKKAKKLRG